MLDHLAKHGRWVIWGPGRHGVAASLFAYIRVPEEDLIVELYADMEQLGPNHDAARLGGHAALVERLGDAAAAHVLPLRPRGDRDRARPASGPRPRRPASRVPAGSTRSLRGARLALRGAGALPRAPRGGARARAGDDPRPALEPGRDQFRWNLVTMLSARNEKLASSSDPTERPAPRLGGAHAGAGASGDLIDPRARRRRSARRSSSSATPARATRRSSRSSSR